MPQRDGICPVCFEHTSAGESCCGAGAWIEGDVVSDEEAQEEIDNEEERSERWSN